MFNSIPVFIAGLSFVAVQGCAVGVPLVAIAVGMGTGAPPPRERNTVLVGDYTLTTTQLYDLNCAAYFEGPNVPDCVSVHFSPVLPDTAQHGLVSRKRPSGPSLGPTPALCAVPIKLEQTKEAMNLGRVMLQLFLVIFLHLKVRRKLFFADVGLINGMQG